MNYGGKNLPSGVAGLDGSAFVSVNQINTPAYLQKSATNTGLTTSTDILVAVAPLLNAEGLYIIEITDNTANQLTIICKFTYNTYNFNNQPTFLIDKVNDSAGVITANNLSNYITFFAHKRTTAPNPYIAVSIRMTGGLLYSASTLKFTCTSYAASFLIDNLAITQYIATSLTNLATPDSSLMVNGTVVSLGSYPASSLYAYCTNGGAADIGLYGINTSTGALSPLSAPTLPVGTTPVDIAITPNGKFQFVSCSGSTNIYVFKRIMLTGILALSGTPFTTSAAPSYMVMHPTGNYLYVVLGGGTPAVSGYSIDPTTGHLTLINSITGGTALHGIAINPLGTFLYVADSSANNVRQFTINTGTGVLTANGTGSGGLATPEFLTVHPNGSFAYVINNGSGSLRVFDIDPNTGVLTAVGSSIATASLPLGICITPNGLFAYVANSGSANIGFYTVNTSTGLLTLSTTYSTGTTPTCIRTSAGGEYLYITNAGGPSITMYSISLAGTLTAITGSPVSAGPTVNQLSII